MPTKILKGKTPYNVLFGKSPSYAHLCIFGCLCYRHNLSPHSKFDKRAKPCIFIGYPPSQKAYKIYDLHTKKVYTSRDVTFYEIVFPYHLSHTNTMPNVLPLPIPKFEPSDLITAFAPTQSLNPIIETTPFPSQITTPSSQ